MNVIYRCLLPSCVCAFFLIACNSRPEIRQRLDFDENWSFLLRDSTNSLDTATGKWRALQLPHDWSIEGPFDEKNPATVGGGALPGGIGWYKKSFSLPLSQKGKLFFIEFDGIYRNSEVWINNHYLGKRPNGYISFQYELTPFLNFGNQGNLVVVKVDNSRQPNSRWYSGSGIYRNVHLSITDSVHVDQWGTFITTPVVTEKSATVRISTTIRNSSLANKNTKLMVEITDAQGKQVGSLSADKWIPQDSTLSVQGEITFESPSLWSTENPYLYKAVTRLEDANNQKLSDEYVTTFGIRSFTFDSNKGFSLNGQYLKILGVCMHHDLGALGAAVNTSALRRQLKILKEMGANAIRTSHNPPAPELLDLCDQMGFIVMDEAFDMWKRPKNKFDYHLDWDQWHHRDLSDQVLRDRNHPSVFIWSIGNEIGEQWDTTGVSMAKELATTIRELDPTRPITSACNDPAPHNNILKSGALDLIGYNYHHETYQNFLKDFPNQKFIATETGSALETRGYYDMPSDSIRVWPIAWDKPFTQGNADHTVSAYDNVRAPWGSTHEDTWKVIKKYDFLSGMFAWTGFDYLGEPTPYGWPSRSSYFGIVDLAGFPKDSYYMYKSEWTNEPVLHIFPHWNWAEGQTVDVWAYSNAQEVELFVNGKSLGTKRKKGDDLHLMWRTTFIPGSLKAIARTNGKEVLSQEIKTAGKPYKVMLDVDRKDITADGKDLAFVTAKILDEDGNVVPEANNDIQFDLKGVAVIAGVDNGDPVSLESFKANHHKALHGLCLVIVRSKKEKGNVAITASSAGLLPHTIQITVK